MDNKNSQEESLLEEKNQRLKKWIKDNISDDIVRLERQARWRGGWWVDVNINGELKNLYVREERKEDFPPWPLEHEASVLRILEKHGVPVPHVYGMCPDPHATVMEFLPGELLFMNVEEEERLSVLNDFAEVVARMHAIDPKELVENGVKMPETAEERSLACFPICEEMYLKGKRQADPRIEFLRKWVKNNIPTHRDKVSIIAVDSGQFLFKDGKVTGLFDFEYGCLGDPMIDIAFIPLRLSMYGAGNIKPFFDRYSDITGEKLELDVLAFHAVWWGLCTPFILTPDLHNPNKSSTYFEYIGWYLGAFISMLDVLADSKGIELDMNDYSQSVPSPSRWSKIFDVMADRIPERTQQESYETTENRNFHEFAKRVDQYPGIESEYFAQVGGIVGKPIADWHTADTELEKFVLDAGPEHDEMLIRLFHKWAVTQAKVLFDGLVHLPMFDEGWPRLSRILN